MSHELTPREAQVWRLLSQGCTNAQIAAQLGITPKTARNHVSNVLCKLGVENRVKAAVIYHLQTPGLFP